MANISGSQPMAPLGRSTPRPPCGNLGESQIMGGLGDPAVPKSRGVRSTPKRYFGHIALGSNSGAHPGPSRTRAPFAPTMSVRIFDHFLQFLKFFAPLNVQPPCVRRTHGPMDHIWYVAYAYWSPRLTHHVGEPKRPLTRSYAKVSVDNFAILALVGTIPAITIPWPMEIFGTQVLPGPTLDSHRVRNRTLRHVSKPPWRNTLGDTFNFGSFFGYAKTPLFWETNFSPPCGRFGGRISLCP